MLSLLANTHGFDEHRAGIPYTNALLGTTDVASKQPPRSMCPAPGAKPDCRRAAAAESCELDAARLYLVDCSLKHHALI